MGNSPALFMKDEVMTVYDDYRQAGVTILNLTADLAEARAQIEKLGNFIMDEIPGEPSQSEGAVDTAIIWMRKAQKQIAAKDAALREIARQQLPADMISDGLDAADMEAAYEQCLLKARAALGTK